MLRANGVTHAITPYGEFHFGPSEEFESTQSKPRPKGYDALLGAVKPDFPRRVPATGAVVRNPTGG